MPVSNYSYVVNTGLISLHRLKTSERLFIHKNLLLTLGLGNLVFVLDKNLFASRQDHVVCKKLRKSCFKQISSFTCDLLYNFSLKEKKKKQKLKLSRWRDKNKRHDSCFFFKCHTEASLKAELLVTISELGLRLWCNRKQNLVRGQRKKTRNLNEL